MKKYYPNMNALKFMRILLSVILFFIYLVAKVFLGRYTIIMYAVLILCGALFVAVCFWILPLYFKKTVYFVSSKEVLKYSGIIFTTKNLMRVKSVQYITTLSTPFSSKTGLNFILLNALGGKLILLFLSKSDLAEISSIISHSIRTEK